MASICLGYGILGRHAGRIRPPAVRFKLRPLAAALKPTGKAAWPGRLRDPGRVAILQGVFGTGAAFAR